MSGWIWLKIIYKDINDAFPLILTTTKRKIKSELNYQRQAAAKLDTEYANKVEGLLYQISDKNESLMLDFRCTYLGFQSDPCNDNGFFKRHVVKLQEQRHELSLIDRRVGL